MLAVTGWCWHDWPKWGEPEQMRIHRALLTGEATSVVQTVQTRRCTKCNAMQSRKVESS